MGYWRTKHSPSLGPETMEKIRLSLAEIKESCLEEFFRLLLWFGRGKDECFFRIVFIPRGNSKNTEYGFVKRKNIFNE